MQGTEKPTETQRLKDRIDELEKQLREVTIKHNLLKCNENSYNREIQELKEEVARLWRLHESIRPFVCKAMKCEKREKASFCPHCGQIINKEL